MLEINWIVANTVGGGPDIDESDVYRVGNKKEIIVT